MKYKLDLLYRKGYYLTWTSIPTSPRYIRYIDVRLHVHDASGFSGDGGSSHAITALLKLTRRFLQNDPHFGAGRRLDYEMELWSITVIPTFPPGFGDGSMGRCCYSHDLGRIIRYIWSFIMRLANSGLLYFKVKLLAFGVEGKFSE